MGNGYVLCVTAIQSNIIILNFRPTMIKYGLNNIRDLVGSKVDMEMIHNNPICRLEK